MFLLAAPAGFFLRDLPQSTSSAILRTPTWSTRGHWSQRAALWFPLSALAPRREQDQHSASRLVSGKWFLTSVARHARRSLTLQGWSQFDGESSGVREQRTIRLMRHAFSQSSLSISIQLATDRDTWAASKIILFDRLVVPVAGRSQALSVFADL